jgi:peptide/nickel transport system substrate-binding protein
VKTPAALLLFALSFSSAAADLSVALGGDVTSIDPHFHNLTPNNNVGAHIFDTLVMKEAGGKIKPGLAESWRVVDELTWEFKLRKGVRFHDGSDFTAADVVFSLDRIPNVPNSPSPFTTYTKQVTEKIVVDPWTIRLKTAAPYPQMPNDMSTVLVVSAKAAANATTEDFNSGRATIGTGPFRFVRWQKGDRIDLARNDAYWGQKSPWEKVTFRIITSDPTRVASLMAGEVRAIENVPTGDLAKLAASKDLSIYRTVSVRLMYLHIDTARGARAGP